ncbi:MAG: hypothetical protein K2K24_03965, partial [Clostridia bacterium]|nr:hypothetical protein [Clostridia bacterium]
MDIRKRKLKGCIALSILIITCLIMASAMTFYAQENTQNAVAITDFASCENLGELLLSDYGSRSDNLVFDGDVMAKLIKYATCSSVPTINAPSINSTDFEDVKTSAQMRSNYKKEAYVTINGKKWIIAYLSPNDDSEPILTLWLANTADNVVKKAKYNNYSTADSESKSSYPANLYGSSAIRAVTLNNGGKYAESSTDLTDNDWEKDVDNEWAIYTMGKTEVSKSITEFIEIPTNMSWQRVQTASTTIGLTTILAGMGASAALDYNNDALDKCQIKPYPGWSYEDKEYYKNWGSDKMWLPSITEVGFNDKKGIWELEKAQRVNETGINSWLRTARVNTTYKSGVIVQAGTNDSDPSVTTEKCFRTYFHLKLAKAYERSTVPVPEYKKTEDGKNDTLQYYSETSGKPDEKTFYLEKVDKRVIEKVELTTTNLDSKDMSKTVTLDAKEIEPTYANGGMSFKVQEVGKYTIKITLKGGQYWVDGTTVPKTYDYYLKYALAPLDWTSSNSKPYNGQTQYLELSNYDEDKMTVTPAPVKVSKDGSGNISKDENGKLWAIPVKDVVKDKEVEVKLKNTTFMNWKEDDGTYTTSTKKIKYTITAKTLIVTPVDTKPWSIATNKSDATYDVYVDVCEEDIDITTPLSFEMWYKKDEAGATEYKIGMVSPQFEVDENGDLVQPKKIRLTLTMPSVATKGDYKYILKLASGSSSNANYTLNASNSLEVNSFKVEAKKIDIEEKDIIWRYTNTKLSKDTYTIVDKTDTDKYDAVNKIYNLDYNGAEYEFSVDTSKLDTDGAYDVVNGTVSGTKADGKTSVKKATNVKLDSSGQVDYYEVIFTIKVKDGVTGVEVDTDNYTLKWRINKAKFDLSDVVWDYEPTKPKEYN